MDDWRKYNIPVSYNTLNFITYLEIIITKMKM